MADEENVDVEENVEPVKEKKGKSKKLIIIIAAAVVLIGGGGFAGWKYFLSDKKLEGGASGGNESSEQIDQGLSVISEMKPFIVNLLGNQGKRYLKARIDLEVSSEDVDNELQERKSQIRDAILLLLASKTFDDISDPAGKNRLRNELIVKINELLNSGLVKALYFTEFVVQ